MTTTPGNAESRIQTHRTGDLALTVRRADGTPVTDATVSVTMREHAFRFGTGVEARYLVEESSPGDPYRERLAGLFNTGVVEHRNKWRPWENESERELAIRASEWLLERGLDLRGHAAIWQRFDQPVVPEDVVEKVRSDDDDRAAYVSRRTGDHVSEILGHYAGDVASWDVLNEQIHAHHLTDVIDPDASHLRAPEVVQWFERARQADPEASLYLNDYDVLAGEYPDYRDDYAELVRFLQERGAPIDGLGFQAHHDGYEEARSPDGILDTLDRFADLGVAITVTEYDTVGDGWTDERAADHLRTFLRTVFSHPAVEGFVMWGFWDGVHWAERAPLFREDWSAKPALDVYRSLVFEEWWTDETGTTDADGRYRTTAFLGKHDVTVETGGRSRSVRASVTDPVSTTELAVEVPAESP